MSDRTNSQNMVERLRREQKKAPPQKSRKEEEGREAFGCDRGSSVHEPLCQAQMRQWRALGFNTIPYDGIEKTPLVRFKHRNSTLKYGYQPFPDEDFVSFLTKAADVRGAYLLVASGPSDRQLVVFDLDFKETDGSRSAAVLKEMREDFLAIVGNHPYVMGRKGQAKHLYFRTDVFGASLHKVRFAGPGTLDIIGASGVALPGTRHRDGYENELGRLVEGHYETMPQGRVPARFEDLPSLEDYASRILKWLDRWGDVNDKGVPYHEHFALMYDGQLSREERFLVSYAILKNRSGYQKMADILSLPDLDEQAQVLAETLGLRKPARRSKTSTSSTGKRKAQKRAQQIAKVVERVSVEWKDMGNVSPDLEVRLQGGGKMRLGDVPVGTKVHVPAELRGGKEDHNPSGTVYEGGIGRCLYDWSKGERWLIAEHALVANDEWLEALERMTEIERSSERYKSQEPQEDLRAALPKLKQLFDREQWIHRSRWTAATKESVLEALSDKFCLDPKDPTNEDFFEQHGIEIVEHDLQPGQYVADVVPPIEDEMTVFLVGIHGIGKTVFAKREVDRAVTVLSTVNTKTLTIANAEALGLEVVETKPLRKGSACVLTLPHYKGLEPPEFFHIDEMDATMSYLHSGNADKPLEIYEMIMEYISESKRSLCSSADLTPAEIAEYTYRIRKKVRSRKVRIVIVRRETDKKIDLMSNEQFQIRLAKRLQEAKAGDKIFFGSTSRKVPIGIVRGFTKAHPDLAKQYEDCDTMERPVPKGVAQEGELRGFTIHGDNSRLEGVADVFHDPNGVFDKVDVVAVSPALQSGVSITRDDVEVFCTYDNLSVPAETVLQMLNRVRRPKGGRAILGINRWGINRNYEHKLDIEQLRKEAETRISKNREVVRYIAEKIRSEDFDDAKYSAGFLNTWVFGEMKKNLTRQDPIGRLVDLAISQGYKVRLHDDPEDLPDEDFQLKRLYIDLISAVREEIKHRNAKEVAEAEEIDAEERERIRRANRLTPKQRAQAIKYDLIKFYEQVVDSELVLKDREGRYRKECIRYQYAIRAFMNAYGTADMEELRKKVEAMMYRETKISEGALHLAIAYLRICLVVAFIQRGQKDGAFDRAKYGSYRPIKGCEVFAPWTGGSVRANFEILRTKTYRWWHQHFADMWEQLGNPRPPSPDSSESSRGSWVGIRFRELGLKSHRPSRKKGYSQYRVLSAEEVARDSEPFGRRLDEAYEEAIKRDTQIARDRAEVRRYMKQIRDEGMKPSLLMVALMNAYQDDPSLPHIYNSRKARKKRRFADLPERNQPKGKSREGPVGRAEKHPCEQIPLPVL